MKNTKLSARKAKPVVAILANRYAVFQKPLVDHMTTLLNAAGYGVLCVAGGTLDPSTKNSPKLTDIRSAIYSIAPEYDVAGYIVLTITIGYNAPVQDIVSLVMQFRHRPIVSLGVDIPTIPSVGIDNKRSMTRIMEHMTEDADRQRFVFIRGFKNMPDSAQRESVFREVLAKKGIRVDENLILDGNFISADSYDATDELLNKTHDIDAIVAASDEMAVSAIHACNKHGLVVPDDVIVSGFDDSPMALNSSPPLTTIGHALKERSAVAVEHLLDQIEHAGRNSVSLQVRDGNIVVRESSLAADVELAEQPLEGKLAVDIVELFDSMESSLQVFKPPDGFEKSELLTELQALLHTGATEISPLWQKSLRLLYQFPEDALWWKNVHQELAKVIRALQGVQGYQSLLSTLLSLQVQIHEGIWSVESTIQFEVVKRRQLQDRIHLKLAAVTDMNNFNVVLMSALAELKIPRAYLVLYETPGLVPDINARLVLKFTKETSSVVSEEFSTHEVLPAGMTSVLEQELLVLSPLCTGDTHFGYLLLDPAPSDLLDIENFSHSISNAVCYCIQIQDLQQEIEHRQRTETQSRELQDELAHLSRLTTMGQFATGIAHELNQPLTAIIQSTDAALMTIEHADIQDPDLMELLTDIDAETHRAGDIIKSLRQFLRKDESSRKLIDLNELVNQSVRLVDADARAREIEISLQYGDIPKLCINRVQIAQVLVNLLRNGIDAICSTGKGGGHILVATKRQDDHVVLEVSDSGPGIEQGMNIFDSFETSKSDGMGMGLPISRSIVESHNGKLWVDKEVAAGARFAFTLPVVAHTPEPQVQLLH